MFNCVLRKNLYLIPFWNERVGKCILVYFLCCDYCTDVIFFFAEIIKITTSTIMTGKNRGLTLIVDSHANIASPGTVGDDFEGLFLSTLHY